MANPRFNWDFGVLFSVALPLTFIYFIPVFPMNLVDLYRWFGYDLPIFVSASEWTRALRNFTFFQHDL